MRSLIALFLLVMSSTSLADIEWSVQINGLSWHTEQHAYNGEKLNDVNTGVGVQATQPVIGQPRVFIHWSVGTLINSMDDRSWYAGAAVVRRWGDQWRFDAGFFLGVLTYPSYEHGWLIMPAPFFAFGTKRAGVNFSVLPGIGDLPTAALLQLRAGF